MGWKIPKNQPKKPVKPPPRDLVEITGGLCVDGPCVGVAYPFDAVQHVGPKDTLQITIKRGTNSYLYRPVLDPASGLPVVDGHGQVELTTGEPIVPVTDAEIRAVIESITGHTHGT